MNRVEMTVEAQRFRAKRDGRARTSPLLHTRLLPRLGFVGLITAVSISVSVSDTKVAVALIEGTTLAVVLYLRPEWTIGLVMISAWAVRPASIPLSFRLAGATIYLDEMALVLGIIYACGRCGKSKFASRRSEVFGIGIAAGLMVAVLNHIPLKLVLADARGPLSCLAAYVIAARIGGSSVEIGRALRILRGMLWWNLGMIGVSSATGLVLAGRTDVAGALGGGDIGVTSMRFLTNSSHLAFAVMCGIVAIVIVGRTTFRSQAILFAPAFVITFLSFSRNNVLGIAAGCVFAIAFGGTIRDVLRGGWRIVAFAVLASLAVLSISAPVLAIPGGSWLNQQVQVYSERVISGLNSHTLAKDSSANYRRTEIAALVPQFKAAPWTGHGFGYAYKGPVGAARSFTATAGRYYAHEAYLWMLVKMGIVGLASFVFLSVTSVLRRSNRVHIVRLALAASGVALLAVSFVNPLPEGTVSGGAIVLGATLGLLGSTGWLAEDSSKGSAAVGQVVRKSVA